MSLRSLLFCPDEQSAQPIREVLTELGVEVEPCPDAATAVEKLTHESFQIILIDWDRQAEAALLLGVARERKAGERPLTLAIVSGDADVQKALQAGANSILRKPFQSNQAKDTLKTARDLLRARQESAAAKAAAGGATSLPTTGNEPVLRAGEFLQTGAPAPAAQFDVESDFKKSFEESTAAPVDPLKELEPMAASVDQRQEEALPPPVESNEPRGLEWYLNRKRGPLPVAPKMTATAAAPAKPELIGYEQTPSYSQGEAASPAQEEATEAETETKPACDVSEQKAEEQLFAYMAGEDHAREEKPPSRSRLRLSKGMIITAAALAACAIAAAPMAPWHSNLRAAWGRGQRALQAWLNPQPVTPQQAPASHEDFARAGDEYKLPVAENIPDATTDPSQIRVTPVVDPTAKKANDAAGSADRTAAQTESGEANASDGGTSAEIRVQENPSPTAPPQAASSPAGAVTATAGPTVAPTLVTTPSAPASVHTEAANAATLLRSSLPAQPAAPKNDSAPPVSNSTTAIPSSLKSQMASMTPDASGNKPIEAALPSIEPVDVPEATERGLVVEQPAVAYPASAKGQQGTVVLQLLIGRDGSVLDAKFLQGSLAFARTAIDGVRQWKFKPYLMNGRAVSVQTAITLSFRPPA